MDFWKNLLLSVMEVSVSTSLIILILLLLAPFWNKRYAAKWRYYIWIGLAVRLAVPVNIHLPVRQFEITVPALATAPTVLSGANAEGGGIMLPLAPGTVGKAAGITVMDVAAVVWLAVSAGMMLMHLYSYFRFRARIVRKGSCVEEKLILEKLFILEEELGIKKSIPVIKCRDAASPMIIGFFRPLLVIPESTYGGEELFFMLKHELIHLKRHDTFFKLLFVAARAVHWFNPVVALVLEYK